LVQYLDEAIKEVKMLGEHGEESSQKITELEALCKKLREDTQRSKEEKATLEGMVESHDAEDEEEEEDADDGGDAAATPTAVPPPPAPLAATPEKINDEGPMEMIPEQEAPVPHEIILADVEPVMP
jgi:hypothetical protein